MWSQVRVLFRPQRIRQLDGCRIFAFYLGGSLLLGRVGLIPPYLKYFLFGIYGIMINLFLIDLFLKGFFLSNHSRFFITLNGQSNGYSMQTFHLRLVVDGES
jgi:hypothetical protein